MVADKENNNPLQICTLDPNSNCTTCINLNKISCKRNPKRVLASHLLELSFILMAVFGSIILGYLTTIWWPLIFYVIFLALFFLVIQPRVTCSHCPYYAENRRFMHCSENIFAPKIWKFHPEPISKPEKAVSIIGFAFLGIFPLVIELYTIWTAYSQSLSFILLLSIFGIFLGTLLTLLLFYGVFFFLYCPECVNFSCAFNQVPKQYVDVYLKKNPVMKKAWEEHGYTIQE